MKDTNKVVVYDPENYPDATKVFSENTRFTVFLAGTIDNGSSDDWQDKVIKSLQNRIGNIEIAVFNPRRKNWDPKAGREGVLKQIDWEQTCLQNMDAIPMVILDTSQSPITLLELGLFATTGKITMFCTDKFYRYENVEDACKRYNVKLINSTDPEDVAREIMLRYHKSRS